MTSLSPVSDTLDGGCPGFDARAVALWVWALHELVRLWRRLRPSVAHLILSAALAACRRGPIPRHRRGALLYASPGSWT